MLVFLVASHAALIDLCRESFNVSWSRLSWGGHQGGSSQPTPAGIDRFYRFAHSWYYLSQHLCDWQHCAAGRGRDTAKGITGEAHSRREAAAKATRVNQQSLWVRQGHHRSLRYCNPATVAAMAATRRTRREAGIPVAIPAAWETRSWTGQGRAQGTGHEPAAAASRQGRSWSGESETVDGKVNGSGSNESKH